MKRALPMLMTAAGAIALAVTSAAAQVAAPAAAQGMLTCEDQDCSEAAA